MKVLYDHQAFTGHMYGGVARYFYELINQYNYNQALAYKLSLQFSNNEYIKDKAFVPHRRYEWMSESRLGNQFASLLNRAYSVHCIQEGQFDVFHPTYYHKYFLDYIGSKPFVLTFHDATSERYGEQFPAVGDHLPELKKKLLQRADRIITVSEYSKQELQRFFDIHPDRVQVIYLGTSLGTNGSAVLNGAEIAKEPFPYLLYVGKRSLYKNFNGFFDAIRPILKRHPDIHLICAGGGEFTREELTRFDAAGLLNRVHFRPITDSSLLRLYQQALAFVFPSLNEGFGIPVLEAFQGGSPALLSNRSSLPEVGGDAALYFDPEDAESMAAVVEMVLFDDALRAELRQRGYERVHSFSCEKTAAQTLTVYQSLV